MDTMVIIGFLVGFLLGVSGIATLFGLFSETITSTEELVTQFSTFSTIVLLVIAIILIAVIKIVSSLVVGVIIGAVLNVILEINNVNLVNEVGSIIMNIFA